MQRKDRHMSFSNFSLIGLEIGVVLLLTGCASQSTTEPAISKCKRVYGQNARTAKGIEKAYCYIAFVNQELKEAAGAVMKNTTIAADQQNDETIAKREYSKVDILHLKEVSSRIAATSPCPTDMKVKISELEGLVYCMSDHFPESEICPPAYSYRLQTTNGSPECYKSCCE